MDNQDQRRTHTPGHESPGVHVCHKCGWPFPNPHPSAKHRRAHKKICGTVEGYKLCVSEGQTHLNGSDDEHASDDDHKAPDLLVSGPKALDTCNTEKGNDGTGEKSIRSEDEVFSDAVADFSDSGPNPGIKERLQEDSLDSGTNVERVDIKDPKFSGSSEDNDFDAVDVSQLIVKSSNDCQVQNPKIFQSERIEVENTKDLPGQLSGSTVDPLSNSIADLRTEELTVVNGDDFFGFSSETHPSKAEPMPEVVPENNIAAGENVTDFSLASLAKETNLKEKDEINSDIDMVEIVNSSDNVVGETCEVVSKIAVSDAVSLDHQVADGAVNLKEKNGSEFLSVIPQGDLPLELKSVEITNASTNDVQVESARVLQFATSSDVKILQEKGEGNANADTLPALDDRPDVAHPQGECEDFKDNKGVVYQDPLTLHSSDSLKHEKDDLKDTVTEENNFLSNTSQLIGKGEVLSPNVDVMDSSFEKELVNSEPRAKEIRIDECTEVSQVKLTVESDQRLDEIGASMSAMKTEMNESHMVHFSEEQGPDVVCSNAHQICLPEGSLMASSNENQRDASLSFATSETTGIISIDNISHYEQNKTEINDVAVDGKGVEANVENDIEIKTETLQPSDLLQLEVKQSSDSFKNDDAGEMDKNDKCDITDAQCRERPIVGDTSLPKSANSDFESPLISDFVTDGSVRSTNIGPLPAAREDIKDEINSNVKVHEESNRFVGTSADAHGAHDAELSVKAAEDLPRKYSSLSSLNTEPSVQHDSAVEDNQDGEPGGKMCGIPDVPVQDQNVNNKVTPILSGFDASVDSSSRCDSLEGNWGSVSVLSMQSDAPAVIDTEGLPPTGLLASTEAGKSNLNNPKAASERQQSGKSEMFEPPSFMTLIEPRHVDGLKAAASEVQQGQNPQEPNSTSSQAGWFPTLTQVINESQGRKKNEEIIDKVTNWSTSKEHTPLKSLLGEASHSNKPKSPKLEENSVNQKNGKVPENNSSGLTTVNSILGPESPAAQAVKREAAQEWNSPARYPADIKKEKRKVKSRPYWIQLVCCSSVDPHRR